MFNKLVVRARIENLEDAYSVHHGKNSANQVRTLTIDDAVVDTDVSGLMIPTRQLASLGLRPTRLQPVPGVGEGSRPRRFEAVRLTVQERECILEVLEIPDDSPVMIGRIPLLALDWVVDPIGRRLIGNPEHGGQHMAEAF